MNDQTYVVQSYHCLNPFREGATVEIPMASINRQRNFENQVREIVGDRRILNIKKDKVNRQFVIELFEDKEKADRWENDFGYLYRI